MCEDLVQFKGGTYLWMLKSDSICIVTYYIILWLLSPFSHTNQNYHHCQGHTVLRFGHCHMAFVIFESSSSGKICARMWFKSVYWNLLVNADIWDYMYYVTYYVMIISFLPYKSKSPPGRDIAGYVKNMDKYWNKHKWNR